MRRDSQSLSRVRQRTWDVSMGAGRTARWTFWAYLSLVPLRLPAGSAVNDDVEVVVGEFVGLFGCGEFLAGALGDTTIVVGECEGLAGVGWRGS